MKRTAWGARRALLVLALFASVMPFVARPSSAQNNQTRTVTVAIERVEQLECVDDGVFGCFSPADFYAKVRINGSAPVETAVELNDNVIAPNWVITEDVSGNGTIPIKIELWDSDGFLAGDDDPVDIDNGTGRVLDLDLNLATCRISRDANGNCGQQIRRRGFSDDRAEIRFRITAEEPVAAQDLMVRCLHSRIWPQPGQNVAITAEALTGSGTALSRESVDRIEIWVNNGSTPARVRTNRSSTTHNLTATGSELSYGCRIVDNGQAVFSGWRSVMVGQPGGNQPVPVLLAAGSVDQAIDLVFYADDKDYSSASSATFISDVRTAIRNYYVEEMYLRNQQRVNFWVAQRQATVPRIPNFFDLNPGQCIQFSKKEPFADANVILHRERFRDCAPGGSFTSEASNGRVLRHETGHSPFGLADEYCCDGGYFQSNPFPNVYRNESQCREDAPNYGKSSDDCRLIDGAFPRGNWFVADARNNLMNGGTLIEGATKRRMEFVFNECEAGRC